MKSLLLPFLFIICLFSFTTVFDSPQQTYTQDKTSFPVLDIGLLNDKVGMKSIVERTVLIRGEIFINQFFKDQNLSVFVGSDVANPFKHPEWYSFAMLGNVSLNEKVDSYLVLMSLNNKEDDDYYFYLVNEVNGKVTSIINIAILSEEVFVGCQVNRDNEGYYLTIRRGSLSISDMVSQDNEDLFEPDIYTKLRLLANGTIRGSVIPPPGGKTTYAHKDFNDYYKIDLRISDYQRIMIGNKTTVVCNIKNNTSKTIHITDFSSAGLIIYSDGEWLNAKVENNGNYTEIVINPGKSVSFSLSFVVKEVEEAANYNMRLSLAIPGIGTIFSNLASLSMN